VQDEPRNRIYDSPLRVEQAGVTRLRVVGAAREVFLRRGYAATSVVAIAAEAGVSRETVYKTFGTKARILKAVYDAAVVGDAAPVPVTERAAYQKILTDPDPRSALRTFGRLSAELVGRIAPVLRLIEQAGDEPDLAELVATTRQERLEGVRHLLAHLTRSTGPSVGADMERAVDIVWTLISPEVTLLLVDQRGWSMRDYGAWLGEAIAATVLDGQGAARLPIEGREDAAQQIG